ncbi:hypothetical protein ACGK9U_06650 [Mariniflexile sp. HNIBRBA6329]|uniref:hypothetical protein n=1 Tax=Mariniflexile sp. HNIBRBA6329 TaxID=3373088 RepID=UPI003745B84B
MEKLQSRILIQHEKGATIAYLYNRESFDLLKIDKDSYDDSQFLEIGQIIEYDGRKLKIVNINFKMEKDFYDANPNMGINLYSPTDPSGYNCQIGIFVKDI